MGQTGFCENLRFSAVSCENQRFPVVFCENLRLQNAVVPRKSENLQRKSAKNREFGSVCPLDLGSVSGPQDHKAKSPKGKPHQGKSKKFKGIGDAPEQSKSRYV